MTETSKSATPCASGAKAGLSEPPACCCGWTFSVGEPLAGPSVRKALSGLAPCACSAISGHATRPGELAGLVPSGKVSVRLRKVPVREVPVREVPVRLRITSIAICERVAARDERIAIKVDSATVPICAPMSPAPTPSAGCGSDKHSGTKRKGGCCHGTPSGITRVRVDRRAVHDGRTVLGYIYDFRIRGLDDDRLSFCRYCLLGCAIQISSVPCVRSQHLNRGHHTVRIVEVGVAERRGPRQVLTHVMEYGWKLR